MQLTKPNIHTIADLDLSIPQIMGIANVTPDSFSDGGRYTTLKQAISHIEQLIEDGATIIDIGGESTRPHASPVSLTEELERVIPVVKAIRDYPIVISIDTSSPEVMIQAAEHGAKIWNDVRGLKRNNAVATAVKLDLPVVIMHSRGEPQVMDQLTQYDCVVQDVKDELSQRVATLIDNGIKPEHIVLDPGFGFAKTSSQNIKLLNNLWQFQTLNMPLLVGVSRKRFIGEITQCPDPEKRDLGSATAHLLAIQQGASIIRTHNATLTREMLKVWYAIQFETCCKAQHVENQIS